MDDSLYDQDLEKDWKTPGRVDVELDHRSKHKIRLESPHHINSRIPGKMVVHSSSNPKVVVKSPMHRVVIQPGPDEVENPLDESLDEYLRPSDQPHLSDRKSYMDIESQGKRTYPKKNTARRRVNDEVSHQHKSDMRNGVNVFPTKDSSTYSLKSKLPFPSARQVIIKSPTHKIRVATSTSPVHQSPRKQPHIVKRYPDTVFHDCFNPVPPVSISDGEVDDIFKDKDLSISSDSSSVDDEKYLSRDELMKAVAEILDEPQGGITTNPKRQAALPTQLPALMQRTNAELTKNFFQPVLDPNTVTSWPDKPATLLLQTVLEVLSHYEEQGKVIQDIKKQTSSEARTSHFMEQRADRLQDENQNLQHDLHHYMQENTELRHRLKAMEEGLTRKEHSSDKHVKGTMRKLSRTEEALHEQKGENEALKKQLTQYIRNEEDRKRKELEKDLSEPQGDPGHIKDLISHFDRQRQYLQEEIDYLRKEVKEAKDLYQEKDRELKNMSREHAKIGDNELQFKSHIKKLQHGFRQKERHMLKDLKEAKQKLDAATRTTRLMEEEAMKMKLEIQSRPSAHEVKKLKNQTLKLQKELAETKSVAEIRECMSTRDLIKKDKESHKLHLSNVDQLPTTIIQEIIQDLCRVLQLTDVTHIVPAVKKMSHVLQAVPSMEKFVKDVCHTVSAVDSAKKMEAALPYGEKPDATFMQQVTPTLWQWANDLKRLPELEAFRNAVAEHLSKRPQKAGTAPSISTKTSQILLSEISELVQGELNVQDSGMAFIHADHEIRDHPDSVCNKIVGHFMHLFEVKSSEGVFPKMNELYVTLNEMNNCLSVLRSALKLAPRASVSSCIKAVENLTSANPVHDEGEYPQRNLDQLPTVIDDRGLHHSNGLISNEQFHIVESLKDMLSVSETSSILPLVKRLIQRIQAYDDVFPSIDQLLAKLYEILDVKDIPSVIPALTRLIQRTNS